MADRKISELTALTAPAAGDYLPIVDISEAAAVSRNKRITIEELFRGIPLGTAAAPSIAIEGDENTGIYSPGADQLAISTGGTGRLFVDASGNVGVGGSPTAFGGGVNALTVRTTAATGGVFQSLSNGGTDTRLYSTDTLALIGTFTNTPLSFYTNTTERLRITSDGKLGLGTSSPAGRLHVANGDSLFGNGNLTRILGASQVIDFTNAAQDTYVAGRINGLNLKFYTNTGSGIDIDSSGRVGIGTASPSASAQTHIYRSGGNVPLYLETNQSTSYVYFQDSGSNTYSNAIGSESNKLLFVANGSQRAQIDSSGRLGLGTSSPSVLLDVYGTGSVLGKFVRNNTGGASGGVTIGNNDRTYTLFGDSSIFQLYDNTAAATRVAVDTSGRVGIGNSSPGSYTFNQLVVGSSGDQGATIVSGTTNTGSLAFARGTTGTDAYMGLIQYSHTSDFMRFFTGGTERIRIDSSGRLGIGDNAPDSTLVTKGAGVSDVAFAIKHAWGSSSTALMTASTSAGELMRLQRDGKLLLGTSTSTNNIRFSQKLAVVNAGADQVTGISVVSYSGANSQDAPSVFDLCRSRGSSDGSMTAVGNGDSLGEINFRGTDGTGFITGASIKAFTDSGISTNDLPSRLVFSTTADGASSPTERMRITNGGNILVNATSVVDQGLVLVSYNGGLNQGAVFADSDATSGNTAIRFKVSGTTVGSITTTSSATAYNTSSDYRLKENVVPLTGAIDRVNQLQVHRFNFIADPDKTVDGFIAHEAQAVVPECVTGTKDEVDADGNPVYQGIDQSKLVPLLTAALQEALAKIETLEARVTALEP